MSQIRDMVEGMLRPIRNRIVMSISRAVIESVIDNKGSQLVKLSLLKDENQDGVERFQQFGFTSNPPPGTEAIAVFIGGNREHGVVIATEHRAKRKKNLATGETAIYTDPNTYIHIKADGTIEIKTANQVKVTAPNTDLSGNLNVMGAITAASLVASGVVSSAGTTIAAIKAAFNAHTHIENGALTNPPLPVIP